MKCELKKVDQTVRHLSVTIDPEAYQKGYQETFQRYSKKVQIDGFRKGKAPASTIQRLYGEQIQAAFVDENLSEYYRLALVETNALPVTQGSCLDVEFPETGEVVFIFEFESLPEDFSYEYKDLEVEFKPEEYKDEMLEKAIQKILYENAEEIPFDEQQTIEIGDKIKLMSLATDVELPEFELSELTLAGHVGPKANINAVIGLRLNDKFQHDDVEYQIIDAFRRNIPPLTDETAKILGHDTVDAMRQTLKENLQKEIDTRNELDLKYAIAFAFGLRNIENVTIPREYLLDIGKRLIKQHLGGQIDEKIINGFEEGFILSIAEKQKPSIIWDVAFEQIAKDHDITVTEEEIDAELERYATNFGVTAEELKTKHASYLGLLKDEIISAKTVEFLKPFCKISAPFQIVSEIEDTETTPKSKKRKKKTTTDETIDIEPKPTDNTNETETENTKKPKQTQKKKTKPATEDKE